MNEKVIHVGLDVDDVQYHGCALNRASGECLNFKCRPTLKGLVSQLKKMRAALGGGALKVCYEASYVGFCLHRDLTQVGIACAVVAPTSIPSRRGKAVKTDRLDAADLAEFYANGQLTEVTVPQAEQEADRDLLRSRQRLVQQQGDLRRHLQGLLRRIGRHYKAETQRRTQWSRLHYHWIEQVIEQSSGSLQINLRLLLGQLKSIDTTLVEYGEAVDALATSERYEPSVRALTCYKGIANLFALTMITEIGDVKRFTHPRKLVSWIGMDIREYASGGKSHRFGITRQGNRYLRTAFIEANQRGYQSVQLSREIKARREGTAPPLVAIADRALKRLNRKRYRLLAAGKHPNKVKVACAREMVGFVWESLNAATADQVGA